VISVPDERADWARTHADLIAGEILATSFEFGDPGSDAAEIGDGVRVGISKAGLTAEVTSVWQRPPG
jgi:isoleucyl-tRNA synthetase